MSQVQHAPVFCRDDDWYFWGIDIKEVGPFHSEKIASEKYEEYCAYTMDAPGCHHPSVQWRGEPTNGA